MEEEETVDEDVRELEEELEETDDPRYASGEETIDESGRNPTQRRIDEEFEPDDAA